MQLQTQIVRFLYPVSSEGLFAINGLDQWTRLVAWTGGLDQWPGQVDWTGGLDYWPGQVDWTGGLDQWPGQVDWTGGLDRWTDMRGIKIHPKIP